MLDLDAEWLEADGLGGFASGTVGGRRTRRYHALLLTAVNPPTDRMVLVNGLEAFVTRGEDVFALSTQHYLPNVVHPDGHNQIESFEPSPWPTWVYQLPEGTRICCEIVVPRARSAVIMRCSLLSGSKLHLTVRPLLSGRDYHATHHENAGFQFESQHDDGRIRWQPYRSVPPVVAISNGQYEQRPLWYRQFLYAAEQARGLDCTEDLASPGTLSFDLADDPAILVLTAEGPSAVQPTDGETPLQFGDRLIEQEHQRRSRFRSGLHRAADAYLVRRGEGTTIIAGYPWFTDWGRDTFIALRGLCLATGRFDDAEQILSDWAGTVSEGMLPNRFPDHGEAPEYNSVDASLWYVIAVHEFLEQAQSAGRAVASATRDRLRNAVRDILDGYTRGTRYGIRADDDGLLLAGEPGVQLTWMDAKVGDWVVTPRSGKPVEVQALWINALWIAAQYDPQRQALYEQARASFHERFWNPDAGCLYDVVDVDGERGRVDASIRPNQVFAVGGLPVELLDREQARCVVDIVEQRLLTPMGLRSLDPAAADYKPHYDGDVWQRDGAYHQGTVWPWLIGPFVEAWVRVRDDSDEAKEQALARFVHPLLEYRNHAGLGHVSEIADAAAPHTPRGCPFQAWSLGELLRLKESVLRESLESSVGRVNGKDGIHPRQASIADDLPRPRPLHS